MEGVSGVKAGAAGAATVVAGLLVLVTALQASAAPTTDRERGRATAGVELEDWRTLTGVVGAPWPARQLADGSFPDYMAARGARHAICTATRCWVTGC